MRNKKSLAKTHPEIAKEWHPTKNGILSPDDLTYGSRKKVWWQCPKGDDHIYLSSVAQRTSKNQGCSVCAGRQVVLSNCLATLNVQLASQWHPKKNGNLTPFDVVLGSNKKVWWKCEKGDDHEWIASVNNRSKGRECPICSGKKVVKSNCLAVTHPEIAKQWHPTKNGKLSPADVSYGSNKKVWWKCDKGDDHEWILSIAKRTIDNQGCKVCSNKKIVKSNCLATTHPELSKQWHYSKNGDITPNMVFSGSTKKVWWKCEKGDDHEWIASIVNRSKGRECPICSGKKVVKSNCLASTHPQLLSEWHPTKNGSLSPTNLTKGSNRLVWWKCNVSENHVWKTYVYNRVKGKGCPFCTNQKVNSSNCLETTHPEIAKQWHPNKNGNLTPEDITAGSGKKVWWRCEKNKYHEWRTSPVHRTKRFSNCPFCTLTPQSRQELTITFELINLFENINPRGYKTKLNGTLRSIDIFIPSINLCIEFDGNYWHKNKRDIDKIKSEMLLEKGFKVIRVREEPLKKIFETDIISKTPYDGKIVTNDILSMILSLFDLDTKLISKIKTYQSKKNLQNEKGLEKYIEGILTEKVSKGK